MELQVNGEAKSVPEGTTVAALLELLDVRAARVAVEVNAEVVKKADYGARVLRAGEQVEIVAFVGGG
ncbi:MAG: sulfur carrier protein ThiS [Deltaproteobacteria bacterium]|nr:sulfur carrier protein ThiS [Deltaproteobacteria bacterium]